MNKPTLVLPLLLSVQLLHACHDHEGEHGHDHAAADADADEPPTLDVTVYEGGLELFMEYPSFIVGRESPLVAHFSDTRDPEGQKGIGAGRVTATLAYAAGGEDRFVADAPQRLGVFKPVVKPTKAGKATLTLQLEGSQAQGVVHVGDVVVYPDLAAAKAAEAPEAAGGEKTYPYFKEAMWKTVYATAPAEKRVLRGGIAATGEIQPVAGQAAELSAPTAARVVVREGAVPHVGQAVRRGQTLFTLVPLSSSQGDPASVELELAQARAELGLKQRDAARSKELLASGALSQKQADAADVDVAVATARVEAATKRLALLGAAGGSGGGGAAGIDLRAPLDGIIAFADVMPGSVVDAGQRLAMVINAERVWLSVAVPEVDVAKASESQSASFTVRGFDKPFVVAAPDGKRVAVGAAIDPLSRTVPVIFELGNKDARLKPGMFTSVLLFTGDTIEGVAVPEEAVLDDDGKAVVYVMDGGESFFLRRVKTGVRADGFVQILEGVSEGERVVSRGAFEIKLANAGGIPAHGHQH
ncbi:MAG: efflux RND transporter periplasmic adaptor subunit [Deltaproteobacteria bacterium]|nr:efflux RND transporter periplasmic adaptor subunit [Deltaproteobacteria bacterium]